jgi:hypothetical protein
VACQMTAHPGLEVTHDVVALCAASALSNKKKSILVEHFREECMASAQCQKWAGMNNQTEKIPAD